MARALLLGASLLWVPWAVAWAVDLDGLGWPIPAALAFLPYVAAATAVVLIAAVVSRSWLAAAVALAGVLALVLPRLGWVKRDAQPAAQGPVVTVATANVLAGSGDVGSLARLVADEGIDVLAVQESTTDWDRRARERFGAALPHLVARPAARGTAGLAIWSRWPLTEQAASARDRRSVGALVAVPGLQAGLHVRSAHPYPPLRAQWLDCWRRCTPAMAERVRGEAPAVLLGDLNATLDHHPLRALQAAGLRDAAEQRGRALVPTWRGGAGARLTLDHALVTPGVAVRQVATHDLPSSDHDVLVARLQLPG